MKQMPSKRSDMTRRNPRTRRAYILIVVLGLATVVSTLGIAFIEANSTSMPSASNRKHAARAQYLAESGVELAKHYLLYPPTTVPLTDYWHGQSNIAIDATSDFTSVSVTRHASITDRYTILARGISKDFDGSVRGKKAVTAEVLLPPGNIWDIRYAMVGKSATTNIPARVGITGNVHGNGALTGSGTCTGEVSACVTALWLGGGPPTAVKSLMPAVALPAASITPYLNYTLRGVSYTAQLHNSNDMSAAQATALNNTNMTATNPGRVIRVKSGNFQMKNDAQLNGTLLVVGDLTIHRNVRIVAELGFPAIVCTGKINFNGDNDFINVTGPIICGDVISDDGKKNVALTLSGTVILTNSPSITGTGSVINLAWNADRSWFYNFESPPVRQPITVLSWRED